MSDDYSETLWKALDICRDAPGTRVEFGYESLRDMIVAREAVLRERAALAEGEAEQLRNSLKECHRLWNESRAALAARSTGGK